MLKCDRQVENFEEKFVNYFLKLHNLKYFFPFCRSKLNKTPNPSQYNYPSSAAMIKKKPLDFSDHAYRDAIGRLKCMLADSYSAAKYYSSTSSIFKSVTDDETDTDQNTIVERPTIKEVSKYFPYKPYSAHSTISSYNHKPSMTSSNLPVPSRSHSDFCQQTCFNIYSNCFSGKLWIGCFTSGR